LHQPLRRAGAGLATARLRRGRARRRELSAAAALNFIKTWLLLAGACALLAGLGWVLGGYRLLSIFVFCGLLAGAAVYWYSDRVVLGLVGARPLAQAEAPAYVSAAERLAARARVPAPRLYLIRDPYPRALSAGRGGRGQTIAVSSGLLAALAPAELEGVLAHELAHAQRRDVLVQTTAAVVAATLLELSRLGGWFQRALLFVLGPIASAVVHGLLSPKREFAADRIAATLCDSPHGIADALARLNQAAELVSFVGNPATGPLHIVDPFEERGLAGLFSTHPPVGERIRRLRALDLDHEKGPGEPGP
jgi:heat shock protein HtpX